VTDPRASLSAAAPGNGGRWGVAGGRVLVASAAAGAVAALVMIAAPSCLPERWPRPAGTDVLVRAWGVTWLALSAVLLAVLASGYRRRERSARLAAVVVPAVWLSHAVLAPGTWWNWGLAAVTGAAAVVGLWPPITGRGGRRVGRRGGPEPRR
jgi:lysylphosphatidylglycerol synthetase-like protein (DUF2156 family)